MFGGGEVGVGVGPGGRFAKFAISAVFAKLVKSGRGKLVL